MGRHARFRRELSACWERRRTTGSVLSVLFSVKSYDKRTHENLERRDATAPVGSSVVGSERPAGGGGGLRAIKALLPKSPKISAVGTVVCVGVGRSTGERKGFGDREGGGGGGRLFTFRSDAELDILSCWVIVPKASSELDSDLCRVCAGESRSTFS